MLLTSQTTPLWIATLNFDNTVERAAEHVGLSVDNGIHEQSAVRFDQASPIKLAKLHGSLNWTMAGGPWEIQQQPVPNPSARIIFGSENKLRVDGPYLDLLLEFRSALELLERIDVCGYSFRDAHVNHTLLRWLARSDARRVHVSAPGVVFENVLQAISSHTGFQLPHAQRATPIPAWIKERFVLHDKTASEWALDLGVRRPGAAKGS
jgi:hypothetical protein